MLDSICESFALVCVLLSASAGILARMETRDRDLIRSVLRRDPVWAVYAAGDLGPGHFEQSRWFIGGEGADPALVLLYEAVTPPVLFAMGSGRAVVELAREAGAPTVYLHVRPEVAEALDAIYRGPHIKRMVRMILEPGSLRSEATGAEVRLGAEDRGSLERLYEDGRETGEAPDFFHPSMVERGVFYGARENGELVAAAGTHLVAPEEGVAAIGNVYTRRDRRGRGLGGRVTSAVAEELARAPIATIALHTHRANTAAISVYRRLGFKEYCEFTEGPAERR